MAEGTTPATQPQQIFPGEVFANTADFDPGIRQLLPGYDEMLGAIARCLPTNAQHILELGCGTGELSLKVLNRYPNAQLIALDYSPRMLQVAQTKIQAAGYADRWTGIEADFGEWTNSPAKLDIGTEFDACISSLAIHHLTDDMKLKLFQRIRESLNSSGCFWNADPILPESPALAEVYQFVGEDWAQEQGTTLAEIRARRTANISQVQYLTTYGYSNQDQLATLTAQMEMLTKAGFQTIAVPWKYYKLAVFGGFVNG